MILQSKQWFCSTDGVNCKKYKSARSEKEIYQKSILRDIEKYNQRIKNIQEQLPDSGLPQYYDSSDLICRQQILGSIFLEKMVFQDGELRTKKVNSAVELICRPPKDLRGNENKESSENSELSNQVPGTGIEPAHP